MGTLRRESLIRAVAAVPVGQLDDIEVVATIAQGRTVHCDDEALACPEPSWRAPATAGPAAAAQE